MITFFAYPVASHSSGYRPRPSLLLDPSRPVWGSVGRCLPHHATHLTASGPGASPRPDLPPTRPPSPCVISLPPIPGQTARARPRRVQQSAFLVWCSLRLCRCIAWQQLSVGRQLTGTLLTCAEDRGRIGKSGTQSGRACVAQVMLLSSPLRLRRSFTSEFDAPFHSSSPSA